MIRLIVFLMAALPRFLSAQALTIEDAVAHAVERHPAIKSAQAETSRQAALRRSAIDLPKTEVSLMRGQFNSIVTDENITIGQVLPFPTTLRRQRKLATELVSSARMMEDVARNELAYRVRLTFNKLVYLKARKKILEKQDSILDNLLRVATLQYRAGEGTLLAKTMAETQRTESLNELDRNRNDIESTRAALRLLCGLDFDDIEGSLDGLVASITGDETSLNNPSQRFMNQQVSVAEQERKLEASRAFPEIKIAYFNQTLIGTQNIDGQDVYFGASRRFDGFQFGVSIPLWFGGYVGRAKAAAHAESQARSEAEGNALALAQQRNEALGELAKNRRSLEHYRASALQSAELLRRQSEIAFASGDIDYPAMLLNLRQVLAIEEGYLTTLYHHNDNLITIHYLNGNL